MVLSVDMEKVTDDSDTTVKLSKNALEQLKTKARPFETKKDCLERIITQNCGNTRDEEIIEQPEEMEGGEEIDS